MSAAGPISYFDALAYLQEHADEIAVRAQVGERWRSHYLSELVDVDREQLAAHLDRLARRIVEAQDFGAVIRVQRAPADA